MAEVDRIMAQLRKQKPVLQNRYGVKTLGVFGSYIRGEQGKRSDVDILVEFERPISLLQFLALERQVSELLGRKVDLVMKTALKPRIGENILREVVYL
jgi:hypothetical protein